MSYYIQTLKAGKDRLRASFYNGVIKTLLGIFSSQTITYTRDSEGRITEVSGSGDIDFTATVTYTDDKPTSVDLTYKIHVFKENLDTTDNTVYTSIRSPWLSSEGSTIYKNGTEITSGFTVDYTNGKVTFDSANSSSDVIEASFVYEESVTYTITWSNGKISQISVS
ncbi:hypothetical protein J7K97_00935 [Candidatus Aerophobetes bacterium]|nr:hypothetical protein [Candidatus Aerophobetes bacterium]